MLADHIVRTEQLSDLFVIVATS